MPTGRTELTLIERVEHSGSGGLDVTVSREPADPAWDAFVDRTRGGHHLQTSLWGQVKATAGWRAVRVMLGSGGSITGGCQVLVRDLPGVGALGYVPRGPLMDHDGAALHAILSALDQLAGRERIRYLKLQPPPDRQDMVPVLRQRGFVPSTLEVAPTATVRVPLDRPEDEILAAMRPSARTHIRSSQRKGVSVRAGGLGDLPTLVRLVDATSLRQGFPPYPPSYYQAVWEAFAPQGRARLVLAEHEGAALSAVLVIGYGDSAVYKIGGWAGSRQRIHPNELVHWEAMRWARRCGYRFYDLDGIEVPIAEGLRRGEKLPPDELPGVTHFKLGFGGEVEVFPATYDRAYGRVPALALRYIGPRSSQFSELADRMAHRLVGRRTTESVPEGGGGAVKSWSLTRTVFNRTLRPVYVGVRDGVVRYVERRNNIDTMGVIALEDLGIHADNRNYYKASEWTVLRRILPADEVGPDDVFVDFGSGLGRVVFQAALRYPFKRVIGVELSDRLNQAARQNIDRNRHRFRAGQVELVTADALSYEIPDDLTVAYFANPFTGEIFKAVIERILDSVDAKPRRLRLIYRNPVEHAYLVGTGRFRPVRRLRGLRPSKAWSESNSTRMYELTPSAGGGG